MVQPGAAAPAESVSCTAALKGWLAQAGACMSSSQRTMCCSMDGLSLHDLKSIIQLHACPDARHPNCWDFNNWSRFLMYNPPLGTIIAKVLPAEHALASKIPHLLRTHPPPPPPPKHQLRLALSAAWQHAVLPASCILHTGTAARATLAAAPGAFLHQPAGCCLCCWSGLRPALRLTL